MANTFGISRVLGHLHGKFAAPTDVRQEDPNDSGAHTNHHQPTPTGTTVEERGFREETEGSGSNCEDSHTRTFVFRDSTLSLGPLWGGKSFPVRVVGDFTEKNKLT